MTCRLFGAKPLPEAMLNYSQLDPWEQISGKFEAKYKTKQIVCFYHGTSSSLCRIALILYTFHLPITYLPYYDEIHVGSKTVLLPYRSVSSYCTPLFVNPNNKPNVLRTTPFLFRSSMICFFCTVGSRLFDATCTLLWKIWCGAILNSLSSSYPH